MDIDRTETDGGSGAELHELLRAALARIDQLEARVAELDSQAQGEQVAPVEPWRLDAARPALATEGRAPAPAPDPVAGGGWRADPEGVGRRRALKGIVLAAGAATAGMVLGDGSPAAAVDGSTMTVGGNFGFSTTTMMSPLVARKQPGFFIYDGGNSFGTFGAFTGFASKVAFDVGIMGQGDNDAGGVFGEAKGAGIGVHGKAVGNVGVWGEAKSSYGVSGTSQSNIGVFGSTASSTLSGVFGEGGAGQGVHGRSVGNVGVYGETTSATTGFGMQAVSAGGSGLKATGKVFGVIAQSLSTSATDAAMYASALQASAIGANTDSGLVMTGSSDTGGGIEVKAPKFHLRMGNAATRGAPTSDAFAHQAGEIVYASSGDTWVCVKSGTPGTWRKVAGPASSGAFHVLPAPVRVYDSRAGTSPATGPKTPLTGGVARTIDLKGSSSGVPAGATAALVTLLVLNTASGNGNLTLWAAGAARPSANTMVWGGAAGGRYTAKEVSALDSSARVQVSSSLKTDIAIDVVGYYR